MGYEGLDTLLDAAARLPDNFAVLIVGDGAERSALQESAHRCGLADRVHFVGMKPTEGIESWYRMLDVFVVPRRDEEVCRTVTPLKPLLAMSLGIPVVASDLPALREVTGGHAAYVPAGDAVALAAAIVEEGRNASGEPSIERREDLQQWLAGRTWADCAKMLASVYRGPGN